MQKRRPALFAWLEHQLARQFDRAASDGSPARSVDVTEVRVRDIAARIAELRGIRHTEALGSQFQAHTLGNRKSPENRRV